MCEFTRSKQLHFNVKYSKEEYEVKVKEMRLNSWSGLEDLRKKKEKFWLEKPYREYTGNSLNLNVTGDCVYESKNSKNLYLCEGVEDSKYVQMITIAPARDCMDYFGWGNNATRVYESVIVGENVNSVYFSDECFPDCINLEYCSWNIAGKNNFGCSNLKRKDYCILNKEYSKEEFETLKTKIIEDMKVNPYVDKLGRKFFYGEFFSPELSNFPYNKSDAMRFFPKSKEEVLSMGFDWEDTPENIYNITIKAESLPDNSSDTTESVLAEIIGCAICSKGYKITRGEFDLLRRMDIPMPHHCPKCRENRRFSRLKLPKFYERNCQKCEKKINTAFSPERPEIIYCEKCYQGEFM